MKLSDTRNLVVLLDKKEKFGLYMCITKNDAGKETVLFTLKQNRKFLCFYRFSKIGFVSQTIFNDLSPF